MPIDPAAPDDRTLMPDKTTPARVPPAIGPLGGDNVLPKGTRLSEFEITGLIGEGGFGIVYLAYDHSLQRNVALKEYMPSALASRSGGLTVSVKSERHAETFQAGLKSFINEARLLAQFDHPSLVKVYRFWEANGTAYMVMPYYEGVTLKETLKKLGAAPDEAWLKTLLHPLTDALALIHSEQCFHRDIAPDNVIILKGGRPLLLDFGAARRVIGDMTHALTVILKPGYAPVEQYAESPSMKQGAWTDIYALAAVVYYAVTGRPPVPSVARMMSDPLEPLAKLAAGRYSEEFLRGADQALAVKPEDRPQSIAELRTLLGIGDRRVRPRDDARQPVPAARPTAPAPSSAPAARPAAEAPARAPAASAGPGKRPVALYAGGGVVALLLVAGAALYLVSGAKKPEPPVVAKPSDATRTSPTTPDATPKPPADTVPETPPPPPPAKVYDPQKALEQIFEARDRTHTVTASADKPRIRINRDPFRFTVASSRAGYLYILMVGTQSDFMLLFPNSADQSNRVAAGDLVKLPRASWPLEAHGPRGTNNFVAIVSDNPRSFDELSPRKQDKFRVFPPDKAAELYRAHTGPAPLFAGNPVCPGGQADCSAAYGAALFAIEEIGG